MATDDFTNYYTDLLDGSYDCVDRMVLNANFGLCYSPGGFRSWWRRLHNGSDAELDNTHLMRMAGRFSRRVRGWAQAHDVPVIDCGREERKHLIAEEHLKKNPCIRGQIAGCEPHARWSPESIAGSLAGSQFTFAVYR